MQVVIIGNGIAGVTTALHLRRRKPDWKILLISGESEHFFSRPALMYIYLGHQRFQDTQPYEDWVWAEQRIERKQAWVTHIDTGEKTLSLEGGETRGYDQLVLALGSTSNRFGWPGQDLERVHGLVSLQELEGLERITPELRHACIVGGGLIGVELAEMLHSRGIGVTILAREPAYWSNALPWEEAQMVTRVIREAGVDLRLEAELAEIRGDDQGRAVGVTVKGGEEIDCQFVGLTAGVRPNLAALEGSDIPTGRGVLVDRHLHTPVDDVWAAGDCAEIVAEDGGRNTLEQLWYTGRMQGEALAANLAGAPMDYDRGIWFNSAKFFDLEWHTYGFVTPHGRPPMVEGEQHLLWQHPDGRHAVRLIHAGGAVVGVNTMGIRFRHRVCEQWIAEKRDLDHVLAHLPDAVFDPELYHRYEDEVRAGLVPVIAREVAP